MKLTAVQIDTVRDQTGADPIPEDNPAQNQLSEVFGDHTFYLDMVGLHVFEPASQENSPGEPAVIVQIAAWTDENREALAPQEPAVGGVMVYLDGKPEGGDEVAGNEGAGKKGDGEGAP